MYIHTRTVNHKIFEAWRSPGRFTKNPDIIRLSSGRLLLVYSDTEAHWGETTQILTILYEALRLFDTNFPQLLLV